MSAQSESQSISLEYELPHPPAKVWRALTDPELLAKWLLSNDMRARVGERFTFKGPPTKWWDGTVHCEILEADLHKRLRYSWRGGPVDTIVTFTLTATPSGGTHLAFEHSGFLPEQGAAIAGSRHGWSRMLGGPLKEVLSQIP
ncbi:MAG TPA: SRPBCC domain-containing protein [Polyangia bacterium]|nr:SRPBCC domain-containing protein [Polyangia bacterium]